MRWWHSLTLRSMLAGSFTLILILSSGIMGSGAWWLFRQSSVASLHRARIEAVNALWANRPGHGGPDPGPPPGGTADPFRFSNDRGPGWRPDRGSPQPDGGPPHFGFHGGYPPPLTRGPSAWPGPPSGNGGHLPGRILPYGAAAREWAPFFAHLLHTTNQQVLVWDDDGQMLAMVGTGSPVERPEPAILKATAERNASYVWTTADHDYLLIPLFDDGHTRYVELVNPRNAADPNLINLERFLVVSGGVAILLGALAGGILARLLSSPLERLSQTTSRVARGALSVRTNLPRGRNEVLQVAQSFDRMVEQVAETFAAQRRFVADASHELRTPLTTIGGMAEVLEQEGEALTTERRAKAVYHIAREVTRMNRLISDLLLLSSAEEAGITAADPVKIQPLVLEQAERVEVTFPAHTLSWDCDDTLAVAWDEEHLRRVLGNLVDNAAKYSAEDTEIHVTARRVGGEVEIQVHDQGVGISAEDLPHVFERFYRADRSRNRRTGGSGLGLALVKALVDGYGARLHIDSEPGRGTTVTLVAKAAGSRVDVHIPATNVTNC